MSPLTVATSNTKHALQMLSLGHALYSIFEYRFAATAIVKLRQNKQAQNITEQFENNITASTSLREEVSGNEDADELQRQPTCTENTSQRTHSLLSFSSRVSPVDSLNCKLIDFLIHAVGRLFAHPLQTTQVAALNLHNSSFRLYSHVGTAFMLLTLIVRSPGDLSLLCFPN